MSLGRERGRSKEIQRNMTTNCNEMESEFVISCEKNWKETGAKLNEGTFLLIFERTVLGATRHSIAGQ